MKRKKQLEIITPYHPGKSIEEVKRAYGLHHVVKLASNENPFGCSHNVQEAMMAELTKLASYPDSRANKLRKKLAESIGVNQDQLIFGNGTDELIRMLARTYLGDRTNTVMSELTFSQYKRNAIIEGAEVREVPHINGRHDIMGIIDAVDENTSIVWICNPNNPTGEYVREHELIKLLNKIDHDILVVCDEAYYEYVDAHDFPNTVNLMKEYRNLVITRTFSKAYGLAGLRIGYGICHPDVVKDLEIVRETFNTSRLAQAAAIAALEDQAFIKVCREKNRKELEQYYSFCWRFGLSYFPTQTNFIFIDMKRKTDELADCLLRKGFIIRPGSEFGCPTSVRITMGSSTQNDDLIAYLSQLLQMPETETL
ncbi:histidinol-phosphate transaminase [Bacillus aquiflavi]|uniref:Histidinol-phosphate aminotransferase n=1 Tax=Bacillus aquiflavi TaxID=2672567 RepID=A0A6B3W4R6_9BACI|nr:histidinol-phosphate transaminase [Bacillus aquiflavi]MBA4538134.1 histidinol-phosphate transaminase [Bacillus aquiflavi]NEY82454.1 histidinol-phosphate transaminase [Bacillus aquiflavi]